MSCHTTLTLRSRGLQHEGFRPRRWKKSLASARQEGFRSLGVLGFRVYRGLGVLGFRVYGFSGLGVLDVSINPRFRGLGV